MDSTTFGNNWFATTARALTTNAYQVQANTQYSAQNQAAANSNAVAGILNQPFFGVQGGINGLLSQSWMKWLLYGAAGWAVVKYVLPMFGIRILWAKGRSSSGRRSILARARAAKRRKHAA